jgi:phosphopantothenoylcysteine decarboxylase/phosphopantothenate--cysteine ligase
MGRMLEAQEIYDEIDAFLQPKQLAGKRILMTAGPTFEAIDAVRGITNRSSGMMGYAIASAALGAGEKVTVVSGPTALKAPAAAKLIPVESAAEMFEAVKEHAAAADIFISVAAVADYRVQARSAQKIKKSENDLDLKLVANPDILAWVAALPKPPFCVGFAAESEKLHEYAEEKRRRKKLPLLAANLAQNAIGADDNELALFDDNGLHTLPRAPKTVLARQLVDHVAKLYHAHEGRNA